MQSLAPVDVLQRLADSADRLSYSANWQPTQCGDSEMRIARDGRWYHQGGLIERQALVQLFSRLLRREGDQYFLVTPVEKLTIAVDDAPFVSINIDVQGEGSQQAVYITTNLQDTVLVGSDHRRMSRLATILLCSCSAVIFISWLSTRKSELLIVRRCLASTVRGSFIPWVRCKLTLRTFAATCKSQFGPHL